MPMGLATPTPVTTISGLNAMGAGEDVLGFARKASGKGLIIPLPLGTGKIMPNRGVEYNMFVY
jgi:hypothetical protein